MAVLIELIMEEIMTCMKKTALAAGMACMMVAPGIASAADEELMEASSVLDSGITNGLNEFGQIRNILLDESGKFVEYIFFETSETFSQTTDGEGFVEIENVEFAPDIAVGEWEVIVEDTDAQRQPEELEVDRSEADHRLLSNLLDESIQFSDQQARAIDDILINPETGEIEYFTVEMDNESFFNQQMRAIPASEVEIGMAGEVTASVPLSEVDNNSKYQLSSR